MIFIFEDVKLKPLRIAKTHSHLKLAASTHNSIGGPSIQDFLHLNFRMIELDLLEACG